ncbi:MAG: glycosyl hydrolase family 65 protein, partial [Acidimicrobiales bacterium]
VFRGRHLRVEATPGTTSYRLTEGDALEIFHFGKATTVSGGDPVVCPTPPEEASRTPPPTQPAGRRPLHRYDRLDPGARGATP